MSNNSTKKRNWAFVIYPESLPVGWFDTLQQTGLPLAISPLHDRDLDPTGVPKKAHFHVIACYPGPTTYNVVSGLSASVNGALPIALDSVKGYYRYLTHIDNPDKAQYSSDDIILINGFNILDLAELTRREIGEIKQRIQHLIRDLNILEYDILLDYLLDSGLLAEWEVASNHTILFDKYISARRNRLKYSNGGSHE